MSAERTGVPAVIEMASPMRAPAIQSSLAVPAAIANAAIRRRDVFWRSLLRRSATRTPG